MPNRVSSNRREFLKSSTVAAAGASLAGSLARRAGSAHASVDDTLRVGLIGCGGRGTGAASQALNADKNVKLVAMGDAFPDRLESQPARACGRAFEHESRCARRSAASTASMRIRGCSTPASTW